MRTALFLLAIVIAGTIGSLAMIGAGAVGGPLALLAVAFVLLALLGTHDHIWRIERIR